MSLKDIRTISELSKETGKTVRTLTRKVEKLIKSGDLVEFTHYRKINGRNQPYIFNKKGIEKITGKGDK